MPSDTRHVFDVCTKEYDFKDTDVVAVDIFDLLKDYWKHYNATENQVTGGHLSVYELVLSFIRNNPKGHYILDEVPIYKGITQVLLYMYIAPNANANG